MSEIKLVNVLLSGLLLLTFVMFSWTMTYIMQSETSSSLHNAPVVSAFNA